MDYKGVDVQTIDLDGDGKKEYIVRGYSSSNGKVYTEESEIALFDSNYKKIATLVHWEHKYDGSVIRDKGTSYIELKDVDYIDIDNDGNMEILISIPHWEGQSVSIYRYKNGKIEGKTNYEIDIHP